MYEVETWFQLGGDSPPSLTYYDIAWCQEGSPEYKNVFWFLHGIATCTRAWLTHHRPHPHPLNGRSYGCHTQDENIQWCSPHLLFDSRHHPTRLVPCQCQTPFQRLLGWCLYSWAGDTPRALRTMRRSHHRLSPIAHSQISLHVPQKGLPRPLDEQGG